MEDKDLKRIYFNEIRQLQEMIMTRRFALKTDFFCDRLKLVKEIRLFQDRIAYLVDKINYDYSKKIK
jgi:hypothetical protein